MAEDESQILREDVDEPEEPDMANNPVYGACTRWLERMRRKRLLRCFALPKIGINKPAERRTEEPQLQLQVEKQCVMVLLVCFFLGLCLERYINYTTPRKTDGSYCESYHRLGDMVTHVRRQVLHQEQALDELEWALDNGTYRNIALVGTSGVGKSETARTLREHFPWPENVKTLSWRESPSLLRVQSMLKNILLCGQNLILIDDLTPLDGHLVTIVNELTRGRKEIAKASYAKKSQSKSEPRLKQLTSIFMLTVDRQQPEEIFQAEIAALKQLPETHVIMYAALEPHHLVDCKNLNGSQELQQDMDKVAVAVHGCKSGDAQKLLTKEEAPSVSFNFLY